MEKVSVIIPAYNKADFTVQTVESVLRQTYPNIEIIVVDDGSTDQTRQRLAIFGSRIQYIYKDNSGACSARNRGIQLAQGEFIAFLDCDDLYEENKIELCVDFLRKNKDFGFVHTAAYFIDEQGEITDKYSHPKSRHQGWIVKHLLQGNYICNSTPVIRRSCLAEVGGFDEHIFAPADWDLWLRLASRFQTGYIDRPLTKYRIAGNYTFNNLDQACADERYVLEKFFKAHPQCNQVSKKQALASYYLRYAQSYLLKDDFVKVKANFQQAWRNDPLKLKVSFLFLYFLFARRNLASKLRKKILRLA